MSSIEDAILSESDTENKIPYKKIIYFFISSKIPIDFNHSRILPAFLSEPSRRKVVSLPIFQPTKGYNPLKKWIKFLYFNKKKPCCEDLGWDPVLIDTKHPVPIVHLISPKLKQHWPKKIKMYL